MDKEFGGFSNYSFICNEIDCAIEDLFTREDFYQYVVGGKGKSEDADTQNSQFMKNKKLDKVLLAKLFFDTAKSQKAKINISANTKKNFENLFGQLFEKIGSTIEKPTKETIKSLS